MEEIALKAFHNSLPSTLDQPRKPNKIVPSINKHLDSGINDENSAPISSTVDASIDYIASENLKPFLDPEAKIQNLIEGLESKNWAGVCESLNDARCFALYHSDLLLPLLGRIISIMVKAMKNPRSALCKTSVMAASDIFKAFGSSLLEPSSSYEIDELLLQLLLKASQDKKFVCEEAHKALRVMEEFASPLLLIRKLGVYVHHGNLRVRAKAAIAVANCVKKMSLEELEEYGMVSLVQMGVDVLNDRLPEAREAARSMLVSVQGLVMEKVEKKEEAWVEFCQSNLSTVGAQSVLKIVSS